LERFNRANLQHNLLFAGELLRLLAEFKKNGVAIAAFKGIVLAESLYRDLSLREFCDLDLIVHQEDLSKAENILAACGYRASFLDKDFRTVRGHSRTDLHSCEYWGAPQSPSRARGVGLRLNRVSRYISSDGIQQVRPIAPARSATPNEFFDLRYCCHL
jgi:hypothetical protein